MQYTLGLFKSSGRHMGLRLTSTSKMALVDYSGSESSDEEEIPIAKATSNKPAFRKVVDRSEPHKIRVSLPEVSKPTFSGEETERPSKRTKVGSGGMSGFNALLPAPKRAAAPNGGVSSGGSRKGGLGSGVNLRTGAAPGFSREPEQNPSSVEDGHTEGKEVMTGVGAPQDVTKEPTDADAAPLKEDPGDEPKPKGKLTMFKPLSVARKPQRKKAPPVGSSGTMPKAIGTTQQQIPTPKVSLFSTGDLSEISGGGVVGKKKYQPLLYRDITLDPPTSSLEDASEPEAEISAVTPSNASKTDPPPQSLDTIASDLNLSKSAKRQLFGRQKNNASAVNIVNFNTDEEYKANEDIRKSGEQVQHNAVRAIAPGKHSLKQLVNMGTAQAEALEESFASGRRNRSEAGSKYGW